MVELHAAAATSSRLRAKRRTAMAAGSRSFHLASRFLSSEAQSDVAAMYAWCRYADDSVDLRPPAERLASLARLRNELALVYGGVALADETLAGLGMVMRRHRIPKDYPLALLSGLEMDVRGELYPSLDALLVYAYRVAGVVGLMMCHILGVSDRRALPHAAHLGMAMQLTNICRDVAEDWNLGRLYIPEDYLRDAGYRGLAESRGGPLPERARPAVSAAVRRLLGEAERLYRSGDRGLCWLPFRAALTVSVARRVYAAIGDEIAARGYDVLAGRAVVPQTKQLRIAAGALANVGGWARGGFRAAELTTPLCFPDDILPSNRGADAEPSESKSPEQPARHG